MSGFVSEQAYHAMPSHVQLRKSQMKYLPLSAAPLPRIGLIRRREESRGDPLITSRPVLVILTLPPADLGPGAGLRDYSRPPRPPVLNRRRTYPPASSTRVSEVWSLLEAEHIKGDSLDAQTISAGAIRGMLEALDDPYASYLDSPSVRDRESRPQGLLRGHWSRGGPQRRKDHHIGPPAGPRPRNARVFALEM